MATLEEIGCLEDKDKEQRRVFETGAVRSTDADDTRFDLISPIGLRRLAQRYALGAKKYGDNNWLKGFPASDLFNHALKHINLYLAGDRTDDHLAGAAWGLFAVMHFEETRPDLLQSLVHSIQTPSTNKTNETVTIQNHGCTNCGVIKALMRIKDGKYYCNRCYVEII